MQMGAEGSTGGWRQVCISNKKTEGAQNSLDLMPQVPNSCLQLLEIF